MSDLKSWSRAALIEKREAIDNRVRVLNERLREINAEIYMRDQQRFADVRKARESTP